MKILQVRQDAGGDAQRSYHWWDDIKHTWTAETFSVPGGHFHAQSSKAGFLPLQSLLRAGREGPLRHTRWEGSVHPTTTKQGPGRSLEHPGPRVEVPMEMPSLRKCWGRDWAASDSPRASTNEHINERIKKGWGRVSPAPSPAVIAPLLRGVASFG